MGLNPTWEEGRKLIAIACSLIHPKFDDREQTKKKNGCFRCVGRGISSDAREGRRLAPTELPLEHQTLPTYLR